MGIPNFGWRTAAVGLKPLAAARATWVLNRLTPDSDRDIDLVKGAGVAVHVAGRDERRGRSF